MSSGSGSGIVPTASLDPTLSGSGSGTGSSSTAEVFSVDVQNLANLYQSGDVMLQNPVESCLIFVAVILASAVLEWILNRGKRIDNKYVRLLVEMLTQEISIVGALALFLMLAVSLIPQQYLKQRYVTLFTWANSCLFFMTLAFVVTMGYLLALSSMTVRTWRVFEEGRMDTEEDTKLSRREKLFKAAFTRYKIDLKSKTKLGAADVPFHDYLAVQQRKVLVRLSDLSYRTWLSLSIIVIANLMRSRLSPYGKDTSESSRIGNTVLFIASIGCGTLGIFAVFFVVLQIRMFKLFLRGEALEHLDPLSQLPFGTAKRSIEFLQIVAMSMNWFVALFATGIADEIGHLSKSTIAGLSIMFMAPVALYLMLLPWTIMSVTILSSLGSGMSEHDIYRIYLHYGGGEDAAVEDEEMDDADDAMSADQKAPSRQSVPRSKDSDKKRPTWLDPDDAWDGTRVVAPVQQRSSNARLSLMYLAHVDPEEIRAISTASQKPSNPALTSSTGVLVTPVVLPPPPLPVASTRPEWLDDDEVWNPDL